MKNLTICIPTYNRSNFVISQLCFLETEIFPFINTIEIIVADNLSNKEHRDKIINYHLNNNFFELKLNQTNLGSIGNIYFLLENVKTDYVWFVSDDDILLTGVIHRLLKILNSNEPITYVFLNYNAFYKNPEIINHSVNLLGYAGYIANGKQCVIDLFRENGTVSMFITSCVYKSVPLKAFCATRPKQLLIDPLLFSFKLAIESTYIETDVFVLERCDAPSWITESLDIFSWQVQAGLIELLDYSYKKKDIIRMIHSTYVTHGGSYLRMLMQAPNAYKKVIVIFLGFGQLKLLFISLKKYLYDKRDKILYPK